MNTQQVAKSARSACKHGITCYRTNPIHRTEQSHPGDDDYSMPAYVNAPSATQACPFGGNCYRRNPEHFRQYSHPSLVPQQSAQEPRQLNSLGNDQGNDVISIRNIEPGKDQVIRARITIKSDKHEFTNAKGKGVMFTMDLIDQSGEIKLTAFGGCVHHFYDLVEVDKIYRFANFTAKLSDPIPSVIQMNRLQLICNERTTILPDICSHIDFPRLSFKFQPLSAVENMHKNETIDILAVCKSYGSLQDVTLKNCELGQKRELILVDESNVEVMLTIWGTNAEKFQIYKPGCVIALKRGRVSDYAVKSIDSSCLSSSTFKVDLNIPEVHQLRKWYESNKEYSD